MTEEQRDNLLLSMNKKLSEYDNAILSIKETMIKEFSEMNKKIEQRDDLLIVLTKEVACLRSDISALDKKFEEQAVDIARLDKKFEKKFEEQRINIAKLENDLLDKIEALFDVREINNDRFNEHEKDFKLVNETLDWHNRRLLKLETKQFSNKKAPIT